MFWDDDEWYFLLSFVDDGSCDDEVEDDIDDHGDRCVFRGMEIFLNRFDRAILDEKEFDEERLEEVCLFLDVLGLSPFCFVNEVFDNVVELDDRVGIDFDDGIVRDEEEL